MNKIYIFVFIFLQTLHSKPPIDLDIAISRPLEEDSYIVAPYTDFHDDFDKVENVINELMSSDFLFMDEDDQEYFHNELVGTLRSRLLYYDSHLEYDDLVLNLLYVELLLEHNIMLTIKKTNKDDESLYEIRDKIIFALNQIVDKSQFSNELSDRLNLILQIEIAAFISNYLYYEHCGYLFTQ